VRRARSKYVKLYRQTGASRVRLSGARGHARPGNAGNAAKAEVFELALARVSARVDVVARAAAEELKAERLAAAAALRGVDRSGVGNRWWWRVGLGRQHATACDEDHRRAQARRVLTCEGRGETGEEGLALTVPRSTNRSLGVRLGLGRCTQIDR